MSRQEAEQAVAKAQAAFDANSGDKTLKKALKAAQAALAQIPAAPEKSKKRKNQEPEAAPVAAEAEKSKKKKKKAEAAAAAATPAPPAEPEPAKKKKHKKQEATSIEALQAAVETAKASYKSDKTPEKKEALSKAKAALAAAQPATPAPAETKSENGKSQEAAKDTKADMNDLMKLKKAKTEAGEEKSSSGGRAGAPSFPPSDNPPSQKVFTANLSFQIDEAGIKDFFKDCGTITDIFWIEDKETKRFKGCGLLTFDSIEASTKAVAKTGQDCLGRPITVQFSKPQQGGTDRKPRREAAENPLSEKPEGCTTCFVGNVDDTVEDNDVHEFAKDCGEITQIRWLFHKDTNKFKGCGFVEFADTESVDKFVAKRGTELKGRKVRIDYGGAKKN